MRNQTFVWVVIAAAVAVAMPAEAHKDGSLHDVLSVMKDRGLIDQSEYEAMSARNAAYEARQAEDAKPALSFWGDFRFRSEHIFYDQDETGGERTNRHRARYRLRVNGKAEINEHATVRFRIVSGGDDPRSANRSLGDVLDFSTDDLRLDLAYVNVSPFTNRKLGENGTFAIELGKVPNPYVWKRGKDFMLWDADISLEGGHGLLSWDVAENVEAFLKGGYYVIEENSTDKDPHLWAGQVGFTAEPTDSIELGMRGSYFRFESLDAEFHQRGVDGTLGLTSAGGNILDGLSGGVGGQDVQVFETTVYLAALTDTDFPVLLYATYANNVSAEESVLTTADDEDTAWGVGAEIGSKEKNVRLGVGYWHIEANAFPSQFIDSNLFDGRTNREGFAAYAKRQIWRNTEIALTAFVSDEIEEAVPPYDDSVPDAERLRIQADMIFKFR